MLEYVPEKELCEKVCRLIRQYRPDALYVNRSRYDLIKRSEKVAVFSVNGGQRYEVTRIYIRPKPDDSLGLFHYPERGDISANGQFNHDVSRLFTRKEDALWYFEMLNHELVDLGKNYISIKQT